MDEGGCMGHMLSIHIMFALKLLTNPIPSYVNHTL